MPYYLISLAVCVLINLFLDIFPYSWKVVDSLQFFEDTFNSLISGRLSLVLAGENVISYIFREIDSSVNENNSIFYENYSFYKRPF
jgi:ABC-type dipeptide/oligopeptide/nickel transport system permease component